MRKSFNTFLLAAFMSLAAGKAFGFALSGPLPTSAGGEPWQVITIGYALANLQAGQVGSPTFYQDIAGPHNIGEEYRRNTPYMYYAYDANFLGFFGLAGATNCDAAFGVFNALTNVSSYSPALGEFPPNSQSLNPSAQSLYLTDLKSTTMHLIVEQLGLIQPERFTWTLHDRFLPPGCPLTTTYLVVQRNFDVLDTPLNQLQYSPYVNDVLYSYYITEICSIPLPLTKAVTHPFATDPTAWQYSAVAANDYNIYPTVDPVTGLPYNLPLGVFGLNIGGFYSGLTKDDVAGLRYLMNSNNINFEATAPSGALLLVTNVQTPVNITTLPFSLLFSQSATNDPDTLKTNYPGIAILSVITNIAPLITTNITAYFTNLAGPYTNRVPLSNNVAIYPAQGSTVPFTNWSPVQYGDPPILVNTRSLTLLFYLSQFLDPATLQSLYPELITDKVITNYIAIDIQTNRDVYYTNLSVLPTFYRLTNGLPYVTTLTNIYLFTNQPGPTVINYDFTQPFNTISTLDLGLFSDRSATNDAAAMVALYPGLVVSSSLSEPATIFVTNYISYLTNYTGSPYQGPPTLVTKAISTNSVFVIRWNHKFANVFTNHVFTNRPYRITSIWTTNIPSAPYGSPFITVTNTKNYTTNLISGDFFLLPTNWCGFDLRLTTPLGNPAHTFSLTNAVGYAGYTNFALGNTAYSLTNYYLSQFTNYNYAVYPGICNPVVQFSTNFSTNAIYRYQYNFINLVTNHYFSNSAVSVLITNIEALPYTNFYALRTNISNTTNYVNLPGGDFYLIPSNWCGYQIVALVTNQIIPTNIVLTNRSFGNGTITNLQYTEIQYFTFTNYSYSIRPGFCEPALAFTTNYTTNLVTQYQYYFGNIVTNRYYINATNRVVTTNIALLTNGLVGQLTNIIRTNFVAAGIEGDFLPIPPAWCDYTRLATQSIGVVFNTNVFTATNLSGIDLGQQYTQTEVHGYTNMTVLIAPAICDTVPAPPALRQGIERVQFIRANYDSLVGQFFQPITNRYSLVMITNSQMKTEFYQRVITRPDFLFTAADLANGPAGIGFDLPVRRTIGFDTSEVLAGLRGPGTIVAPSTFTYTKVGSIFENGPFIDANSYLASTVTELSQSKKLQWASFDSSTNLPILYPNGSSILNLANSIFIQILPTTMPDGTAGVSYNAGVGVTFTATGGQGPYVWAAPNLPTLVPGMSFNPATQTMSGTPIAAGVFHFTIQVTDSVNRVVNIDYPITIK